MKESSHSDTHFHTHTQGKDKGKRCILTTENHIPMSPFAMPAPSLCHAHTHNLMILYEY
jgi:hypothetical protein